MLAIRGYSSSLAQALLGFLPNWEEAVAVERGACNTQAERHLFAQGILTPQKIVAQSREDIEESFWANAAMTMRQCDLIIATNDKARICVIGSESGFAWSFDGAYAASKAAVHRYVETKKLRTEHQQIICVAPSIIGDSGMTARRQDLEILASREAKHPKGRFLNCSEVCRRIHHELYIDSGYTTNVVIRMNGGQHL